MASYIRHIQTKDAESFAQLFNQLLTETDFLLLEPGEREISVEQHQQRIEQLLRTPNSTVLVVEGNGKLVGHLTAIGGAARREHHRAYLVMGIIQAYTGQGLGTQLFQELFIWAKEQGLHRLELTVMTHNEAAVALYKKVGFEIEGIKIRSLVVNGSYVDEYYMAKLI